jgi:hypothetical protein
MQDRGLCSRVLWNFTLPQPTSVDLGAKYKPRTLPPFVSLFSAGPIVPPTPLPPRTAAFARSAPGIPCARGDGRRGRLCPRPDLARARNVASAHSRPHRARVPPRMPLTVVRVADPAFVTHRAPDLHASAGTRAVALATPAVRRGVSSSVRTFARHPRALPGGPGAEPVPRVVRPALPTREGGDAIDIEQSCQPVPCLLSRSIMNKSNRIQYEIFKYTMRPERGDTICRRCYEHADKQKCADSVQAEHDYDTHKHAADKAMHSAQRASFSNWAGPPAHSSLTSRPHWYARCACWEEPYALAGDGAP